MTKSIDTSIAILDCGTQAGAALFERLNFKGGFKFNYFSAQYCQKYYLNIFAKYMDKYH